MYPDIITMFGKNEYSKFDSLLLLFKVILFLTKLLFLNTCDRLQKINSWIV